MIITNVVITWQCRLTPPPPHWQCTSPPRPPPFWGAAVTSSIRYRYPSRGWVCPFTVTLQLDITTDTVVGALPPSPPQHWQCSEALLCREGITVSHTTGNTDKALQWPVHPSGTAKGASHLPPLPAQQGVTCCATQAGPSAAERAFLWVVASEDQDSVLFPLLVFPMAFGCFKMIVIILL